MTQFRRRLLLHGGGATLGWLAVSCLGRSPEAPAVPASARARDWVPGHLPFVVRLELATLRRDAPVGLDALVSQFLVGRLPPGAARLIAHSDRLWMGMRIGDDGTAADSVVVLEGDLQGVSGAAWSDAFFPARELGGGVRRYDARVDSRRVAPGRVYERLGRVLAVASAAEVDPLERAVEAGRHERVRFPPDEGELAWSASSSQLEALVRGHAPPLAEMLAGAIEWSGTVSVDAARIALSVRLSFLEESDATRALNIVRLVSGALGPIGRAGATSLEFDRTGRVVTVAGQTSWETLLGLLTKKSTR